MLFFCMNECLLCNVDNNEVIMDKNSFDEVWKFSTGRSIFPQVENGVLPCIKFVLKINSMIISILYEIISMNSTHILIV